MKPELKQKALRQLALEHDEANMAILLKEAKKAAHILSHENEYENLDAQLDLLEVFAFRVHKQVAHDSKKFLGRVRKIKFAYKSLPSSHAWKNYKNSETLIIKTLKVLTLIRYQEIDKVLPIFVKYSVDKDETVRKQAEDALKATANYNIEVLKQIGYYPQSKIISYLNKLSDQQRAKHWSATIILCREVLSIVISSETWKGDTIIMNRGVIRADEKIGSIRKSALNVLESLYNCTSEREVKNLVLGALHQATRRGDVKKDDKATRDMITENTVSVLKFLSKKIDEEPLEILEEIEHDAFWIKYHNSSRAVSAAALKIRDKLEANNEYQIFKILIGFKGIFEDWNASERSQGKFKEVSNYRDAEAQNFVQKMNKANYDKWRKRILEYSKIQSDDLATFPHFGKFLEYLGTKKPNFALELLESSSKELDRFILPLLLGLWSSKRRTVTQIISKWSDNNIHVVSCVRLFTFTQDLDFALLEKLQKQSAKTNNTVALIYLTSVTAANFEDHGSKLIKEVFIPSIKALTKIKDARWVNDFWYRPNCAEMMQSLNEKEADLLLSNLIYLQSVEYQSEKVLAALAHKYPLKVLQYFGKRISKQKKVKIGGFEPVPYDFHDLAQPLSNIPFEAVNAVRQWYKKDTYGMFSFRGGRLLSNIFPSFSSGFEAALIECIHEGGEDNWLFVMSILRNYEGETFIHNVCKELAKVIPDGSLTNELHIILDSTGVVSGPLGFAEAYERKIGEIEPWLKSDSEAVRFFAEKHISSLRLQIDYEKKRATEEAELRAYKYGASSEE